MYESVQAFRNFMLLEILITTRRFFQAIPWVTFVALIALLGYRLGGWSVAAITGLLILFPAVTGLWVPAMRSEEHTSELQSLMRISYAVFCLKKKIYTIITQHGLSLIRQRV